MGYLTRSFLDSLNRQGWMQQSLYRSVGSELGLSENSFWVLYILADTERQYTQQTLCSEWRFSKQTVNSTVQVLLEKGLVSLETPGGTKKWKILRLTPFGERFVRENIVPLRQAGEKALARLEPDNRELFIELYEKYGKYLQEEFEEVFARKREKSI